MWKKGRETCDQLSEEDNLSLVGSQVGTPASSARSRTAQDPESVGSYTSSSSKLRRAGSSGSVNREDSRQKKTSEKLQIDAGDDFLSFFASRPVQPQIRKPQQVTRNTTGPKTPKAAWGSSASARSIRNATRPPSIGLPSSARSATTSAPTSGRQTRQPPLKATKTFSHSIFQPTDSARSTLSDEEADTFDALMARISQDAKELDIEPVFKNGWQSGDGPLNGQQKERVGFQPVVRQNSARSSAESREKADDKRTPLHLDTVTNKFEHSLEVPNGQLQPAGSGASAGVLSPKISNVSVNEVTNNMMNQSRAPLPKTTLSAMENSVQNFKPKSPINQMQPSAAVKERKARMSYNPEIAKEDQRKREAMCAIRIQRWYRRHSKRLKASQAALKRLLEAKRQEHEAAANQTQEKPKSEEELIKITKEKKAQQKRQEAIEELRKKREEKRQRDEKLVQEEMTFLQASGKVTKKQVRPSSTTKKTKSTGTKPAYKATKVPDSDSEPEGGKTSTKLTSTSARSTKEMQQHGAAPNELTLANEARASSPSASMATTDKSTTVDDILSALKKLEEDDTFEKRTSRQTKNEKPLAWLDELEKASARDEAGPDPEQSAGAVGGEQKDNVKRSSLLTDEKLKSIMTYLDDLDSADRVSQIGTDLARENQALEHPVLLVPSGEQLIQLEQASAHAQEVTNAVLTQKMELEEKKRTVLTLQRALNQQRELTVRHAQETEKEFKQQMVSQKAYFESKISSQVGFIDQLIEDKKQLSERCDQLVKETKRAHERYDAKIKALEDNHTIELRKLKDFHEAAEKLRREKWFKEMEKTVKEDTVRGMMPELQSLIAKHKSEVRKIKSIHDAELLAADERAARRFVQQMEELREQLQREKETACAHERELARQTYEKHLSESEEDFQQRRRRLYEEVREEKERHAEAARRQRQELDRLQKQLEESHASAVEVLRREYESGRDEQENRHQAELRRLKEELKLEKAAWEENYIKKQDTVIMQKERELKERVKKDRDMEIDQVIKTLEDDQAVAREEYEKSTEKRIRRMREKYEKDVSDLERSEKQATEKYNKTKALLIEAEGEIERLKVTLQQKDKETQELKKLLEKLNEERSHVSDVIRQEFADRLVSTDEENKRLKNEMAELKALHKVEVERSKAEIEIVKRRGVEEMEEIRNRVKEAILKKEEVVSQLKQQYQAAVTRADHLEGLLEQQRKQLLGRK